MRTRSVLVVALLAPLISGGVGCDDVEWPEPHTIDSLRVLGVRAEPPSLTPGASTELSILCVDGRQGAREDLTCDAEFAWFAQCDDPDDNDPENCLGEYSTWADKFASNVAATGPESYPSGFGMGPTFDFAAPGGSLSQQAEVGGKVVRYGTSYVFFVACAGQLVPRKDAEGRLPVECRDRDSGRVLDQRHFVTGVTTLYRYDGIAIRNPMLQNPRFDGVQITERCNAVSECPQGFECSVEGSCLPVVLSCAGEASDRCEAHCLDFELGLDSFSLFDLDGTRLDAARKSLWIEAFTNAGELTDDDGARFGLTAPIDPDSVKRTPCVHWQAPATATDHAHLWAVVRDNRGGLASWDQRIIVR